MNQLSVEAPPTHQPIVEALTSRGYTVYPADSEMRPDLLADHPASGLLALDLSGDDPDTTSMARLNRKIAALRSDIPALQSIKIERRLIARTPPPAPATLTLGWAEAISGAWLNQLPARPLPDDARAALAD